MRKKKLGILGSGYLAGIIARAWTDGFLENYELVGIFSRNEEKCRALSEKTGCKACTDLEQLLQLHPDYVAEAASGDAVRTYAEQILCGGSNLIVLSIGAFADAEFYEKIRRTALETNTRVHIASGAVGGFDVLRTISLMGKVNAGICTHKGPGSLQNTPLYAEHLLTDREETKVFDGTAKDAIGLLPSKVNVAVASSLATAGPEETKVEIYSVPDFVGDDHKITAESGEFRAVVDVYSPDSSIAAWSVVALLQNLDSPIVF